MIRNPRFRVAFVAASILITAQFARTAGNDRNIYGLVKSASGQPVVGAFVKLKNTDRRLTFMVISHAKGIYKAEDLPLGNYVVQGIGNGYQSEWSKPVEVLNGKSANQDLSLTERQGPALSPAWPSGGHLTAAEEQRSVSFPDMEGKQVVLSRCVVCHDTDTIVRTRGDHKLWDHIVSEMRENMKGAGIKNLTDQEAQVVTQYLTSSFPAVARPDPNSRLPRELRQGKAMNYMALQYDVETLYAETHDVAIDHNGDGWIDQRSGGKLGRLDGKTLEYTEVSPPGGKVRMRNLGIDSQDRAWFQSRALDCSWYSYDIKAGAWKVFKLPDGLERICQAGTGSAGGQHVEAVFEDGNVYSGGYNQIAKLNFTTGQYSVFDVPTWLKTKQNVGVYGLAVAGDGNVWFAENRADQMGRLDPETGKIVEYKIQVGGAAFPRRMGTDAAGDIWVGLWTAGKLMKIDHKNGEMSFYDPPTKDGGAYYVSVDKKNNLVWVSLQKADKIDRFNPKTGEWLEFPLPEAESDARTIQVDQTNSNRIWWAGNVANRFGYIEVLQDTQRAGN